MSQLEIKFDRGLNSKIDFLTDAPGHCLTFTDYQLDYGILRPRTTVNVVNASAIGTSSNVISGIYVWPDVSQSAVGNQGFLYVIDATGGKIYRSTAVYAPSSDGAVTFTDITNSVTQFSGPVSWASLNGILVYCGNGTTVNQITSKTANSATLATGITGGLNMLKTVNNILFGAQGFLSGTSRNSTIYWSSVSDPTTWPAGSNLTFRNNDGDSIMALGELNGSLLIFKSMSIGLLGTTTTVVSGTVTLSPLSTLFQGIGAMGPLCVDNLPDGRCVFFGNDMNVYITDGATLTSLTNNPPPGANMIDALSINGSPLFTNSFLRYFPLRREIIVGMVGAAIASPSVFAYDIDQQYWRQITGITPSSMYSMVNPNNSSTSPKATSAILIGNNKGNIIDLARDNNLSPTTQDGSTIPSTGVSASVPIPNDFFESDLVFLTILYNASAGTAYYSYGFDNSSLSTLNTLPTSTNRVDIKLNLLGVTNNIRPSSFQIKFSNNSGAVYGSTSIYKVILSSESTA